jgi:large subunit ribosomal protein L13
LAEQKAVQKQQDTMIVVDATSCIAGRMCSHVSKLLLQGNRVTVVNAERAMLSGNRYKTINSYKEHLEINSVTNPIHGPFHPRRPDTIISKMVRGMIPKRKSDGIEAFKRLRVYMGVPEAMKGASMKSFDDSKITKPESYYISIAEVANQIGWKGE